MLTPFEALGVFLLGGIVGWYIFATLAMSCLTVWYLAREWNTNARACGCSSGEE